MAQRPSGNEIIERLRAWFQRTLDGVLHGPEVGPARTRQGQPEQAPEPEPTEAAREERGRRDAGVAHDAHDLERRVPGGIGAQGTAGAGATSGAAVVTSAEGGGGEQADTSGRQHDLDTTEPMSAADTSTADRGAQTAAIEEQETGTDPAEYQHDLDSVEPPLDTTRASDTGTDVAGDQTVMDRRDAEWDREGSETGIAGGVAAGTAGMPSEPSGITASPEDAIQTDAETGSTWAPVHGDTTYDEMTREPVENAGGQPASAVPDVGGVTGTAGATNLDDSAVAPSEQMGLDDVDAQVSDLRERPPSETDFPDEPTNAFAPEDEDEPEWSATEETAADLQFGSANEQIGFGTFDSRPEEVEEAGAVVTEPDEGDTPEDFGVASGVTEIVPDSDDEALVGDVERDVNADETGGGTNIAAAAAAVDADAGQDAPRGAVRGDGSQDCPPGYPIKGNANSKVYHVPGVSSYDATKAEFCFATEDDAIAAGYRAPKGS